MKNLATAIGYDRHPNHFLSFVGTMVFQLSSSHSEKLNIADVILIGMARMANLPNETMPTDSMHLGYIISIIGSIVSNMRLGDTF